MPSSSLIPNDPTLLLTGAGMNQFEPYFLGPPGAAVPPADQLPEGVRAVRHKNVGHTDRHLDVLEMLGNFSFGDYFKEQALPVGVGAVSPRDSASIPTGCG